jgi:hypothetical protein
MTSMLESASLNNNLGLYLVISDLFAVLLATWDDSLSESDCDEAAPASSSSSSESLPDILEMSFYFNLK